MTVPIVFDKPINIWLGLVLIALLLVQITSGILMTRGKHALFVPHVTNACLIAVVAAIHAYYGIGVWFFDFRYG
ncbi:MAG: hypothetical protein MUP62_01750 [Dehalococcoidia bacterium]|jgi:hypothetical protein|nr:hypothetical protein [Dehalococcoidia bacterium]